MGSFSDLQFLGQISGLLPGKPVQLLAKNMGNLALAGERDGETCSIDQLLAYVGDSRLEALAPSVAGPDMILMPSNRW